ncbi:hypothetical protein CLCR_00982 [Cladophialophora carrionii]|uniref:Uncharacterized protein n=1 Tax=Cladophialophora carrionii TaxID=86049 RepID=A0A1C1D0S6_9EURO|nr:hypothetical protein CLCR_00982 [Cladophialophora carrionii]
MSASRAIGGSSRLLSTVVRSQSSVAARQWICRRCASTAVLQNLSAGHRSQAVQWPLDRRWQQRRGAAAAAAAMLEEAQDDPDSLSQETIIHNLSPEEAHRLSKVRNIGIAVSRSLQFYAPERFLIAAGAY